MIIIITITIIIIIITNVTTCREAKQSYVKILPLR